MESEPWYSNHVTKTVGKKSDSTDVRCVCDGEERKTSFGQKEEHYNLSEMRTGRGPSHISTSDFSSRTPEAV